MRKHSSRRSQRGAEIVEIAIVLPVILIVFLGFVELAVGFFDQAILTQAARAMARETIRDIGQSQSLYTNVESDLRAYLTQSVEPNLISWDDNSTIAFEALATDPWATDSGDAITINLSYDYGYFLLPAFLSSGLPNITLSASATMRKLPEPPPKGE
ncbi:TadE/TadG family type IV pilus assembly protein [uncultured Thiohalocapsa sp.]|uniref:TadE/TadG family type IV pilus assembly protein n=1 Tax=uncultured Thiohalocapsa sp. TaxID=768990 RepID=UPI0025EC7ACD|nr:TadE/TadG family type IV pilus assembly protein [uncultured Thiohalocapsa sp.]